MAGRHTDETEEELLAMNKCDIALFEYAKKRVTPVHKFRDILRTQLKREEDVGTMMQDEDISATSENFDVEASFHRAAKLAKLL